MSQASEHQHRQTSSPGGDKGASSDSARIAAAFQQRVPDLYQILQVTPQAHPADIKRAYRRLVKELHPDHNADPAASAQFNTVYQAYQILSNPRSRAAYHVLRQRQQAAANGPVARPPFAQKRPVGKPAAPARPLTQRQWERLQQLRRQRDRKNTLRFFGITAVVVLFFSLGMYYLTRRYVAPEPMVNLAYRSLDAMPQGLANSPRVSILVLAHNNLTDFPEVVGTLPNLMNLDLGHNELERLPEDLYLPDNLIVLDLSYNKLTHLPQDLGPLQDLHVLHLQGNPLKASEKLRVRSQLADVRVLWSDPKEDEGAEESFGFW